MDNFYSSPFLYFNLKKQNTGAVGTLRLNRKGVPAELNEKLKVKGESKIISIPNEITRVKVYDREVVTLISSKLMMMYNKYMGDVEANDQLLAFQSTHY